MEWEDKAKIAWADAGAYQWCQTINDVKIRFQLPPETRSKSVDYALTPSRLRVGLKGQPPILEGPLFALVVPGESLWTIEKGLVEVALQKQKKHNSWSSVLENGPRLDPLTQEKQDKAMMLEKFQSEHKGFDFSGADFSGQLPKDPASFGDDWKNK
jgi:hypothetical protein